MKKELFVKYIYIQDYSGNDDIYLSIENRLNQLFEQRVQREGRKYEKYPQIRRIKFTNEFYIPPDLQI